MAEDKNKKSADKDALRKKIEKLAKEEIQKEKKEKQEKKSETKKEKKEKEPSSAEATAGEGKTEKIENTQTSTAPVVVSVGAPSADDEKKKKEIEKILEKDLEEIYFSLPPEKRAEFKQQGEETRDKINELLKKTIVRLQDVIKLILKWLSIVPGVNRFFLEQEAKIKADEIIKMKSNF
jgi:hypothetical protein